MEAEGHSFADSFSLVDREQSSFGKGSLAGRGQALFIDAGLGGDIYVLVKSCGEYWRLDEERQRAFDGGRSVGSGQAKKVSQAAWFSNIVQRQKVCDTSPRIEEWRRAAV
jgi:hypothetical protein